MEGDGGPSHVMHRFSTAILPCQQIVKQSHDGNEVDSVAPLPHFIIMF